MLHLKNRFQWSLCRMLLKSHSLFLCGLLCFLSIAVAESAERPNVIVILADDLGYGDPQCYNPQSKIPTPHMDRLAREGMKFTDAHSSNAVCTPSRYSMLTGRYPWRTRLKEGVTWPGDPGLIEKGRTTLGTQFQRAGYRTACIGKWHLGMDWRKDGNKIQWDQPILSGPNQVGFDYFFGIEASLDMDPYFYIRDSLVLAAPTQSISKGDGYRGGKIAPGFVHSEVHGKFTREAVDYINNHVNTHGQNKPFFLYLPLASPHLPHLPVGDAIGKSQSGEYGDFVWMVDQTLGKILQALDDKGISENTMVIFTSDNGARDDAGENGHLTNGPLHGQKGDIHEGGHRVPFLVRYPGHVSAGEESDEVIVGMDLMATFAQMLQHPLSAGEGEDSYDFSKVLFGMEYTSPIREATVFQPQKGQFGIRMEDWFLSTFRGSGGWLSSPTVKNPGPGEPEGELYNLALDLVQENNVYLENPSLVDSMENILERYQANIRSTPWSWDHLKTYLSVPDTVEAENYVPGENGITYKDLLSGNLFNLYRMDDVDIDYNPHGGYSVTEIMPGEWLKYRLSVPYTGDYKFNITYASSAINENMILQNLQGDTLSRTTLKRTYENKKMFLVHSDTIYLENGDIELTISFVKGKGLFFDAFSIHPEKSLEIGHPNQPLLQINAGKKEKRKPTIQPVYHYKFKADGKAMLPE